MLTCWEKTKLLFYLYIVYIFECVCVFIYSLCIYSLLPLYVIDYAF